MGKRKARKVAAFCMGSLRFELDGRRFRVFLFQREERAGEVIVFEGPLVRLVGLIAAPKTMRALVKGAEQ